MFLLFCFFLFLFGFFGFFNVILQILWIPSDGNLLGEQTHLQNG